MASSVKISDLTAKLQENIAEYSQIFAQKLVGMESAFGYMTVIPGVEDQVPLIQLVPGDPLQPGNRGAFEPKDNVNVFKDRFLTVKNIEMPAVYKEDQIEALWRSHLAKISNATKSSPYDMPFEELLIMKLAEAAMSNLRKKAIFKGVLNASGTTSTDLFNGLLTILAADITATNVPAANVATGAAITASNALDQFELVLDKVPSEYWMEDMVCLAAPENVRFYNKDYQATHGALPYNQEFEKVTLDGTSIEIIPEIGMAGSDRVIITPRGNAVFATDALEGLTNFDVWPDHWDLEIGAKAKGGVNWAVAEEIWTNDQA